MFQTFLIVNNLKCDKFEYKKRVQIYLTDDYIISAEELMASLGTVPGVLQNQVPPTTETSTDSPALSRKASKRITAQDGSLILGKYLHKSSSQGEDVNNGIKLHSTSIRVISFYIVKILFISFLLLSYLNKLIVYFSVIYFS